MEDSEITLNYEEILYHIYFHCPINRLKKCHYCGLRDDKCICITSKRKLQDAIYTIQSESMTELSNIFNKRNTFILSNILEYFQQKQVEEVTDFIEDDKIWLDETWPLKKEERQVPIIDIQL